MKIALGADHGGYHLKEKIVQLLRDLDHDVTDTGCFSGDSVDYPDYAERVIALVDDGSCERGILVCGTGIGMAIAANRNRKIRAANCHDEYTARMSREHNDANVLCLGARVTGEGVAADLVKVWLATPFSGGRHQSRIARFSDF
ncbi:ribose 5-phosphate isomerase B [Desulfoprunum benzoelyticum]|uniref:Ribose 5-phosphate isomerase B n=1 Tax=Desulfoprunum benzoelyticum TaxID=1506996 RepID=A0A840UT87_9BACT|nr:ribose 5-phosphate isomerase B [Desulfoprunum benzoelyticum]MBB5348885.1 ribose 5-phosphate isomerase B [Desulfoprunum benzoelyticum]MBM9530122.1 ribose 5-phosphate isomerase B [Desulfoprunum benzoelyticum]